MRKSQKLCYNRAVVCPGSSVVERIHGKDEVSSSILDQGSTLYTYFMIVLDIETTGLEPEFHGLISIGALDLNKPSDQFYGECRIREGEKIDSQALDVNGFTYDEVRDKDKQSTRDLLIAFDEWLKNRSIKMIGGLHIAAFDVPFINKKALQCGVRLRLHRRSIDLHSIAYARMQELGKSCL